RLPSVYVRRAAVEAAVGYDTLSIGKETADGLHSTADGGSDMQSHVLGGALVGTALLTLFTGGNVTGADERTYRQAALETSRGLRARGGAARPAPRRPRRPRRPQDRRPRPLQRRRRHRPLLPGSPPRHAGRRLPARRPRRGRLPAAVPAGRETGRPLRGAGRD